MASEPASASTQATKAELDVISNRVAIALAKREKLIKSWTTSSARERRPEKTQEELDADDAALFRVEPPHLGVGAPVPSHFLISDAEQNHKSLRQKFFPTKGLKASKQRDAEEKAASAKRGLKEESSDDEGGRSSLGKAKKRKISPTVKGNEDDTTAKLEEGEGKQEPIKKLPTPPITPPKATINPALEEAKGEISGSSTTPSEGSVEGEANGQAPTKTGEEARREKKRLKKKMQKKLKKQGKALASTTEDGQAPA